MVYRQNKYRMQAVGISFLSSEEHTLHNPLLKLCTLMQIIDPLNYDYVNRNFMSLSRQVIYTPQIFHTVVNWFVIIQLAAYGYLNIGNNVKINFL